MLKRLAVVGVSAFALCGLFAAPSSAAGGCASLYVSVNGGEQVNQTVCTP